MKNKLPTIDELNDAQAQWMALDSAGDKKEIKRVCDLYERLVPKDYLSVTPDKQMAGLNCGGGPQWAVRRPLADAIAYVVALNKQRAGYNEVRLDIAWCGHEGKWVSL